MIRCFWTTLPDKNEITPGVSGHGGLLLIGLNLSAEYFLCAAEIGQRVCMSHKVHNEATREQKKQAPIHGLKYHGAQRRDGFSRMWRNRVVHACSGFISCVLRAALPWRTIGLEWRGIQLFPHVAIVGLCGLQAHGTPGHQRHAWQCDQLGPGQMLW